jgi:hypothetical protein
MPAQGFDMLDNIPGQGLEICRSPRARGRAGMRGSSIVKRKERAMAMPAPVVKLSDRRPQYVAAGGGEMSAADVEAALAQIFNAEDKREKFLPVTRQALIDRLTREDAWPPGEAQRVRRFFSYLNQWRQQSYGAKLLNLERAYEPFSPDSDLLVTRAYTDEERAGLEKELIDGMCDLLRQANFTRIDPAMVDLILTKDSAYGLDLQVDLEAFDELEIWYRGTGTRTDKRRSAKKFYLKLEEFEVPIFQRLAIVFKLKPEERRVAEVMQKHGLDERQAERRVKRMRGLVSDQIKPDFVYVKLFRNIPRADLEMVFPNTRIRFRLLDKVRLGVTAGGGLGVGVAGAVTKLAAATTPIGLAGAVFGLGGLAVRQAVKVTNQRNKYMVTMAQNLYSHAMADNRGVLTLLAQRAAEEDVKEEVLLYSVLAKEQVRLPDLKLIDKAIEGFLAKTFEIEVNFDVEDALGRLHKSGIVKVLADGTIETLRPEAAAQRIDLLWDRYLDQLPDLVAGVGREIDEEPETPDPSGGAP